MCKAGAAEPPSNTNAYIYATSAHPPYHNKQALSPVYRKLIYVLFLFTKFIKCSAAEQTNEMARKKKKQSNIKLEYKHLFIELIAINRKCHLRLQNGSSAATATTMARHGATLTFLSFENWFWVVTFFALLAFYSGASGCQFATVCKMCINP